MLFKKLDAGGTLKTMIRTAASILTLCMFLWVLPLGNFIKTSQEKSACGGGRAMHMCTMGMGKVKAPTSDASKISFTNPGSVEKTNKPSSGSAGNDFADLTSIHASKGLCADLNELQFIFPKQSYIFKLDPVPKV
jgi:hypothetical protein